MALRTRSGRAWLVGALVLLVVGVPAVGLTSLYLSQHRETTTRTAAQAAALERSTHSLPSAHSG
ncbi:protein of unknown function [Agreia sp. COWG]|nr:protein of unknown function [Agreia sp. COWG]